MRRVAAMTTWIGLLAMGVDASGRSYRAIPPPPYEPPYTLDEALKRFHAGSCARALGEYVVTSASMGGYQAMHPGGEPMVLLDLELWSPPSQLGVRYHTDVTIGLDPKTGDVLDAEQCIKSVAGRVQELTKAIAAAEASPEVRAFVARHPPPAQIVADFDPWVGTRGGIDYVARKPDGSTDYLGWDWK